MLKTQSPSPPLQSPSPTPAWIKSQEAKFADTTLSLAPVHECNSSKKSVKPIEVSIVSKEIYSNNFELEAKKRKRRKQHQKRHNKSNANSSGGAASVKNAIRLGLTKHFNKNPLNISPSPALTPQFTLNTTTYNEVEGDNSTTSENSCDSTVPIIDTVDMNVATTEKSIQTSTDNYSETTTASNILTNNEVSNISNDNHKYGDSQQSQRKIKVNKSKIGQPLQLPKHTHQPLVQLPSHWVNIANNNAIPVSLVQTADGKQAYVAMLPQQDSNSINNNNILNTIPATQYNNISYLTPLSPVSQISQLSQKQQDTDKYSNKTSQRTKPNSRAKKKLLDHESCLLKVLGGDPRKPVSFRINGKKININDNSTHSKFSATKIHSTPKRRSKDTNNRDKSRSAHKQSNRALPSSKIKGLESKRQNTVAPEISAVSQNSNNDTTEDLEAIYFTPDTRQTTPKKRTRTKSSKSASSSTHKTKRQKSNPHPMPTPSNKPTTTNIPPKQVTILVPPSQPENNSKVIDATLSSQIFSVPYSPICLPSQIDSTYNKLNTQTSRTQKNNTQITAVSQFSPIEFATGAYSPLESMQPSTKQKKDEQKKQEQKSVDRKVNAESQAKEWAQFLSENIQALASPTPPT